MRRGLLALLLLARADGARADEAAVTACFDESDRSGYAYPDEGGVWRGAAVELVQALAREAGLGLQLQPLPWPRCLRLAKGAGADAVDFAFYASTSPQRQRDYDFVGPIHRSTGGAWYVVARADLPHVLASFDMLGRYRLCGVAGANYAWLKEEGVDSRVDAGAHSLRAVVTKLQLGRCDYLLGTDELRASAGRQGISRTEMAALAFAPYPRTTQVGYYLLFNRQPPRSHAVAEAFAAALERLSRAGVVERLYREHGLTP